MSGHQGSQLGRRVGSACGRLQLYPVPIRTTEGYAQAAPEVHVKRYVVLYLATLIVLIPIDFLFLGIVAKGFFTSQVGDMLGEIRPVPAMLFYLLYVAGILIFVSGRGGRDLAIDAALRRAVRVVLLRDLRTDLAVAAQALDLAGGRRRRVLGSVRDRGVVDGRADDRQLARAENLNAVIPGWSEATRHPGSCTACDAWRSRCE